MRHRGLGSASWTVVLLLVSPALSWPAIPGEPPPDGPASKVATKTVPGPKAAVRPKDPTGADVVTLRDGRRVLGQVLDGPARGALVVLVGRAWAESHLPDWANRWKKAEAAENAPAEGQRRDRLIAWRRERQPDPAGGVDRIAAWIDTELTKPRAMPAAAPLMVARIPRNDVKAIDRRGMAAARALRLGWTLGLAGVEAMPLADLNEALAGRGLIARGEAPIPLDALLPQAVEPEAAWLRRRAATEVAYDEGLRFVRYGNSVMPEPSAGAPNVVGVADSVLADTIKEFLGAVGEDPMAARFRAISARGRVGAMVTRLDLAPDLESVTVESTLFVRDPRGDWTRAVVRSGTIRSGDVAPGAVDAIADDPQVKTLFGFVEGLGFGGVSGEMKRKSLTVGAMTRRALGLARAALNRDLAAIAVRLDEPAPAVRRP